MMFSDQSAINAHYGSAHSQRERAESRFECEVCGKKVINKTYLKQHLATIHGIGDAKTFQCDICSKVFKYKNVLVRHVAKIHNDQQ